MEVEYDPGEDGGAKVTGPSVFVHGPDVLIDTPEESKYQLKCSGIERINGCLYSHWHADHTMGMRLSCS